MLGDIKKKVERLNELNLSVEEFEFLYMIQLYRNERAGGKTGFTEHFELYYEKNKTKYNYNKFLSKYEELGYIINNNKEGDKVILFNKIQILDKFNSIFIIDIDECWKEVVDIYPKFIYVNDKKIMAQTTKVDLKSIYYRLVAKGGDKQAHQEFLALTDWFYDSQQVSSKAGAMGLERWIMSWDTLKPTLKGSLGINSNSNNGQLSLNESW